jgi:hypothetical protein
MTLRLDLTVNLIGRRLSNESGFSLASFFISSLFEKRLYLLTYAQPLGTKRIGQKCARCSPTTPSSIR